MSLPSLLNIFAIKEHSNGDNYHIPYHNWTPTCRLFKTYTSNTYWRALQYFFLKYLHDWMWLPQKDIDSLCKSNGKGILGIHLTKALGLKFNELY
jgi:hypothetical protein